MKGYLGLGSNEGDRLANLRVDDERLTLPHPEITSRRFVLEPLLELMGDQRVERLGEL